VRTLHELWSEAAAGAGAATPPAAKLARVVAV
jgi:hypothetical protein